MIKLYDIFLRKFIILFTGIFLVLGILFYIWIKNLYIEQIKIDLLHNIDIASLQIKNFDNLDLFAKKIKNITNLRVTIINSKGKVIAESDKDKATMDNHSNRNEIILSKYQEYGDSIRYSNTLKKELLYVAKKFNLEDSAYYLRMARDLEEINADFFDKSIKIVALFLSLLLLSFWVALQTSHKVEKETKAILEFLKNLTKQKKATKIDSAYSIEFNKITKLLTQVSETLSKRDKQKAKYTAKLKISNRQKDDIISAISHEFKNPIAAISGYAQTLLDDKDINENIRNKFLEKIASNSAKLTNMIDRLRLAIRLEEGRQQNKFLKVDIVKLTKNQIEDLKIAYPKRDIIFSSQEKVIIKEIDETLMGIAIINLIENALKYSQDRVEVSVTNSKISIKDYGIGISKKDLDKITKRFYRVSKLGWNNSLGLGLSLVSNILQLHKYKLEIKSAENEGSTFEILFF